MGCNTGLLHRTPPPKPSPAHQGYGSGCSLTQFLTQCPRIPASAPAKDKVGPLPGNLNLGYITFGFSQTIPHTLGKSSFAFGLLPSLLSISFFIFILIYVVLCNGYIHVVFRSCGWFHTRGTDARPGVDSFLWLCSSELLRIGLMHLWPVPLQQNRTLVYQIQPFFSS